MNKVLREGLDTSLAVESHWKKLIAHPLVHTAPLHVDSDKPLAAQSLHDSSVGQPTQTSEVVIMTSPPNAEPAPAKRSLPKRISRKIATFCYRLFRPIFRPIAFRTRSYLLNGLRDELLEEIHAVSVQSRQDLYTVSDRVNNDIQKAIVSLSSDILKQSAYAEQHINQATAFLAQEINKATVFSVQEMQNSTTAITQKIQTPLNNAISTAQEIQNALNIQSGLVFPRLDRIELYSATAARRVAIPCDSNEILLRTEVGFVLCAASDHALIATLVETGDLETGTRHFIQRYLRPGDTFVDVGANIGMHTLAGARAMNGEGQIIAFEPFEQTANMLQKSIWLNGFSKLVSVQQVAVSNKSGQQILHLGDTSGHHSLFALFEQPNIGDNTALVKLVTIDEASFDKSNINLMKIDAEGAELDIIEGSTTTIANNPDIAMIVEFGPSHLRRTGQTPEAWFGVFRLLGFDFRVINADTGILESWTIEALEHADSVNIFFARPQSSAWSRIP